ncbi:hypothetical protein [Hoeflea sp.]|uniref:hypothetical protein n=1 Tax=Hoeflea sp. TaxID=1940281 RepID=UPI0019B3B23A|nr:hypothetical protein [Hoeflea sp.]MBC7280039.1 hypothetical protein [Hoeflea sp.]
MSRPDITAHIKANAKGFHDAMDRVRRDSKVTASASGAAFNALSDKLRGGVAAALAGVTVGAGIKLFIDQAKKAVDEIQEIERSAKTAGVGFEDFQELAFAAKKNLVSVDALTDGLKEMQLRVDEVVKTGKGSAAESLGRLGFSAKELGEALKEPDRLFEDILGRMKQLDKAAQIRVADEIFGGSAGEQFVRMLDEVRGSIADNRQEAQDLGLVISDDLAKRIDELRPVWETVSDVISTRVKTAVLEILTLMGTALDSYNEIANRTAGTLEINQGGVDMQRVEIENKILRLKEEQRNITGVLAQAERRQLDGQIAGLNERLAALTAESEAIAKQRKVLIEASESNKPSQGGTIAPSSLGYSSGASKVSDAERQRKKILELIAALEHEGRTLRMNETDQRIANELRKAGALITPEQTATITRLVQANEAEKRSREEANEALERQSEIYNRFGGEVESTLDGLITKSMTLEQALVKVGVAAIKALLDISRVGGSPGGGIGGMIGSALSGLLGGGFGGSSQAARLLSTGAVGLFAKGGVSNQPAIFAEAGPEAAVPLPDGRRIPVDLRGAGGGGGDVSVSIINQIDATGADSVELRRTQERLMRMEQELPGRIVTTVKDAQQRRVLK